MRQRKHPRNKGPGPAHYAPTMAEMLWRLPLFSDASASTGAALLRYAGAGLATFAATCSIGLSGVGGVAVPPVLAALFPAEPPASLYLFVRRE